MQFIIEHSKDHIHFKWNKNELPPQEVAAIDFSESKRICQMKQNIVHLGPNSGFTDILICESSCDLREKFKTKANKISK